MSNVFFTSDLHWFHRFVSGLRGFGDTPDGVAAHNAALAASWKSMIKRDDIVWVLGDLVASNGALPAALEIMHELPGRKRLIYGNHDAGHPMHRDAFKFQSRYAEVFEFQSPFAKIKVAGKYVLLSHFPYRLDHTADARYTQWRLRDEGMYLLHGHTHNSERYTSSIEMHVGVDAWDMALVPLCEVEEFVS